MIKLKPITESSWLIIDAEQNQSVGLLSENPDASYFMIMGDQKAKFNDRFSMKEFFEYDVLSNVVENVTETDKENYINGYPVDLEEVYPIYDHESGLPVFTKSEKSDIYYCAGYYCIKFPKGWVHGYMSKWETLEKYGYLGPFKTLVECRAKLSYIKRKEKDDERTRDIEEENSSFKEE